MCQMERELEPISRYPIAIDGPAASGKTTVGKLLAERLNRKFLDTGLLYRYIAMCLLSKGFFYETCDIQIEAGLPETVLKCIDELKSKLSDILDAESELLEKLYMPEVSRASSIIAKLPELREKLNELQRHIARKYPIVAVGRDSTTEVFVDSPFRFFLTASLEERARRRYKQLKPIKPDITFESILEELRIRDEWDTTREIAPLKLGHGVKLINTEGMKPEEVVESIINYIKSVKLAEGNEPRR